MYVCVYVCVNRYNTQITHTPPKQCNCKFGMYWYPCKHNTNSNLPKYSQYNPIPSQCDPWFWKKKKKNRTKEHNPDGFNFREFFPTCEHISSWY